MLSVVVTLRDVIGWDVWLIGSVGLLSAGCSLLVGRRWLNRRRAGIPSSSDSPATDDSDPFLPQDKLRDRRGSLRRGGGTALLVRFATAKAEETHQPGWLLNRSEGGLGLLLKEEVAIGAVLHVRAQNTPDNISWIQVVVNNKRWDGDRWELGCRYLRTPPWSALMFLS
jgi:hypothetical protein